MLHVSETQTIYVVGVIFPLITQQGLDAFLFLWFRLLEDQKSFSLPNTDGHECDRNVKRISSVLGRINQKEKKKL